MGRGRRGFFDDLARLPWPIIVVVAVLGHVGIRYGIPAWLARQQGPFAQALGVSSDALAPLAWLFLIACLFCAVLSYASARKRRQLLDTRTGLDSLAAIGWRDFERLVGEAFRKQGYTVEETGLGGADGGIDLILRKGRQRTLVQCKQWRCQQVPVNVVREMYGLLAHHGAHAVRIATVGNFTKDAARFAAGKPIELIDGATLLAMIRDVQRADRTPASAPTPMPAPRIEPAVASATPAIAATPDCPRCGSAMVERTNRRANSTFWGCTTFPACRGTR
ncbi:restriction endonuclease [Luteimonas sp. RIT-PG2_3]